MPSTTHDCVIRRADSQDINALVLLWLRSTIKAHPFISESYWLESAAMVKETFLPQARTWVACRAENKEIVGFISVLNQQFIGALFIIEEFYGSGLAQELMSVVKNYYSKLLLEVYQQNDRAVAFYRKEGFGVITDTHHPGTGLPTWVMSSQSL
ncbi:MAG: N-acetyltransferase [Rouxiella badensis]